MKARLHSNIYDYSAVVSLENAAKRYPQYSPANEEFLFQSRAWRRCMVKSALSRHLHDDFVRHVPLEFLEGQAYAVLHTRLFADHTFLA